MDRLGLAGICHRSVDRELAGTGPPQRQLSSFIHESPSAVSIMLGKHFVLFPLQVVHY